jgi:hypothetical protein
MLEEIIQHQYNVLLQSVFFDVLVGKNFVNAFVKFMGKCWNCIKIPKSNQSRIRSKNYKSDK